MKGRWIGVPFKHNRTTYSDRFTKFKREAMRLVPREPVVLPVAPGGTGLERLWALSDIPPPGWFHVGFEKDVPENVCYVGRYGDRYAWVTLVGVPRLPILPSGAPRAVAWRSDFY